MPVGQGLVRMERRRRYRGFANDFIASMICSRISRNAAAISGSNCRPDSFRTSANAASTVIPRRYGVSNVIASNASATAVMRASRGIWSPANPSGNRSLPNVRDANAQSDECSANWKWEK